MGDFNSTTEIEIIGAESDIKSLIVNNAPTEFQQDSHVVVKATVVFKGPDFSLPDLSKTGWKVLDALPEIQKGQKIQPIIHHS
jgi:beta-galactosidase